ncbi:ThuA domain-containing protein [Balneolaceae bacterium ANBcel3]|nr:ThuA domain-containing protein [Balneolaceae bacterium ANBcel3]
MKTVYGYLFLMSLLLVYTACGTEEQKVREQADPKAHVLLLTGGGWHDYDVQKEVLVNMLEEELNISVDVDHSAGDSSEGEIDFHLSFEWAETYDLVIYNMCFDQHHRLEESRNVVQAHVDHTLPAVAIHCAVHSYNLEEEDAWHLFLGVRSVVHQDHFPFTVEVLEPAHPIMATFPDEWVTPNGELYNIIRLYDETVPLAHAYGEETGEYQVTTWTNNYDGVPVFGTTIGHHNETFSHPVFLEKIKRGVLWALDGFDEEGNPQPGWMLP